MCVPPPPPLAFPSALLCPRCTLQCPEVPTLGQEGVLHAWGGPTIDPPPRFRHQSLEKKQYSWLHMLKL